MESDREMLTSNWIWELGELGIAGGWVPVSELDRLGLSSKLPEELIVDPRLDKDTRIGTAALPVVPAVPGYVTVKVNGISQSRDVSTHINFACFYLNPVHIHQMCKVTGGLEKLLKNCTQRTVGRKVQVGRCLLKL